MEKRSIFCWQPVADSRLVVKLEPQLERPQQRGGPLARSPQARRKSESPHLCLQLTFRGLWVLCFFMASGKPQVKLGSQKAISPQIASCFPGSPDGYCILSCFRVRTFIFVRCLDMILSNTSFIYAFACFWSFWMKHEVLAWEQKISEDVDPGLTGSAPARRVGFQLVFLLLASFWHVLITHVGSGLKVLFACLLCAHVQ